MKKMKNSHLPLSKKRALLLALCLSLCSGSAFAAEADFKTEEYYLSNGLDLVNAASAYAKGYSGRGIALGVCDTPVNFSHPEFSSKNFAQMIRDSWMAGGKIGEYDWSSLDHGTHVAGIMGAGKNGIGMHGVAYNADLVGVPAGYDMTEGDSTYFSDIFAPFYARADVKAINNSWGDPVYFDEVLSGEANELLENATDLDDFSEKFMAYLSEFGTNQSRQVAALGDAAEHGKLLIFAAGNLGHPTPTVHSLSGWFYDAVQTNLINVTALNNNYTNYDNGVIYTKGMERQSDGTISGDWLITDFSEGAKYAEEYTLTAPGNDILSTNADFAASAENYVYKPGTSMAAPFVTGVAGLVQEAFPYMTGKQIGDTLLSTANNNITVNKDYFVIFQRDDGYTKYNVYYFDSAPRSSEQIARDLIDYLSDSPYYPREATDAPVAYYNVPLQAFIGQGVVDAGKAVNGPGALNARRLAPADVTDAYSADGSKTVMYPIDTQGYDSTWSNDIKEIKVGKIAADSTEADLAERYKYYDTNWLSNDNADAGAKLLTALYVEAYNSNVDSSGMEGLHVGLIKSGEGRLSLTGHNTYEGASVARGGTFSIDGFVAGDAYSVESGTIAGRGSIGGTLYNKNIAVAGDAADSGDLTMKNLVSTGTLVSHVTANGSSRFVVQDGADVTGSKVLLNNALPGESREVLTAGTLTGNVANTADNPQSTTGMLSTYATTASNTLTATAVAANNLGAMDGQQSETYRAMNAMYQNLDTMRREEMRPLYNLSAEGAKTALDQIGNADAAQMMSAAQTSAVASRVISDRLATAFSMQKFNVDVNMPVNHFADSDDENSLTLPVKVELPAPVDNNFWVKFTKNWGELKGGADYHGQAISGGYDRAIGANWRTGLFVSYNATGLGAKNSGGNIYDTRIGVYGIYHRNADDAYIYIDGGKVRNKLHRSLSALGLGTEAKYDSNIFEIGGEYKHNLQPERIWQVSPFINLQFSTVKQDSYAETGAGIFNQHVNSRRNNYFAGQLGVEFKRQFLHGHYAARLGVKHAFTGANPELNFSYEGDANNSYTLKNNQDKTHLIISLNGENEFAKNWLIGGDIQFQKGSHDRDLSASVMLRKVW